VPIDAKAENFPGAQSQGFADSARASQPSAKILSLGKILNAKPLAAPVVARRSATALGRDVPPNLTGVNSSTGAGANQGILSAFLPAGGRAKEPHLVLSSVPNYPVLAKRAGIEGEVTIAAVIDINGKLTSMTVVSGSPLLQQAALDSLRNWKYEPAYLNDKPVPVQTSVTVKFRLH
jgi:TonB family protein